MRRELVTDEWAVGTSPPPRGFIDCMKQNLRVAINPSSVRSSVETGSEGDSWHVAMH